MQFEDGSIAFEKFEVLQKLGSGGMGTVYKARDRILDRVVVLKILSLSTNTAKSMVRFQNEAKTLSRLEHVGIARVYDFGVSVDQGEPYLVLEYIDGVSFDKFISSTPRPPLSQLIGVFVAISDALEHAHNEGIVHRDIKPGNIMIGNGDDGLRPVLIDFGIAKQESDSDSSELKLTAVGGLMGSPLYISPEQCSGGNATSFSDQYSLGCVIYESLTGEPPFIGNAAFDTVQKHMHNSPPELAEHSKYDLPSGLSEIVNRLLTKDPDGRFDSMGQLADELERVHEQMLSIETAKPTAPELVWQPFKARLKKNEKVLLWTLVAVVGLSVLVPLGMDLLFGSKSKHRHAEVDLVGNASENVDRLRLAKAKKIEFGICSMDDKRLKPFDGYEYATEINLSLHQVSDKVVAYFRKSKVKILKLNDTSVHTLDHIPGLKTLTVLEVRDTSTDDRALDNLVALPMLSELSLDNTKVTDAGLKTIRRMGNLSKVSLSATAVSKEAVEELARAMPNCLFVPFQEEAILGSTLSEIPIAMVQKRYDEAIRLLQHGLETTVKAQGPNCPKAAWYYLEIAICMVGKNRLEEARVVIPKAISVARRTQHIENLERALEVHAQLLEMDGKLVESIDVRKEQANLLEQLGLATKVRSQLRLVYQRASVCLGPEETRLILKDLLRRYEPTESNTAEYLSDLSALAVFESNCGNLPEARRLCQETIKKLSANKGKLARSQLIDVYACLSLCMGKDNRFDKAIEYTKIAVEIAESENSPLLESNLTVLAHLYFVAGQPEMAKQTDERQLALLESRKNTNSFVYAVTLSHLGDAEMKLGNFKKGDMLCKKALVVFDGLKNLDSGQAAYIVDNYGRLAVCCRELGDREGSLVPQKKALDLAKRFGLTARMKAHRKVVVALLKRFNRNQEAQKIEQETTSEHESVK